MRVMRDNGDDDNDDDDDDGREHDGEGVGEFAGADWRQSRR